jgi:hypothetical protein
MVLEGGLTEDSGLAFSVGDTLTKPPGSSHAFTIDRQGCMAAVILFPGGGSEAGGTRSAR